MAAMVAELGTDYLGFALDVLESALPSKGYMGHIRGYTLHYLLQGLCKVYPLITGFPDTVTANCLGKAETGIGSEAGKLLAPSQLACCFVSDEHSSKQPAPYLNGAGCQKLCKNVSPKQCRCQLICCLSLHEALGT